MSDIFISYAREDRNRAEEFADALTEIGWSVWWDRKTPAGMSFSDVIKQQLETARCVIVLWSTSSVQSEWVEIEASHARQRGILVPVLIDDVADDVPLEFTRTQAARLVDWNADVLHEDFESLEAAVRRLVPLDDRTVVTGQVRDAGSGEPLPEARVSIGVGSREFITTSDDAGRFQWREDRSFVGETLAIEVAKNGYGSWSESRVVQEGDVRVDALLEPERVERPFVVGFTVVDESERPLSGAEVLVSVDAESVRSQPTGADGRARIELAPELRGRHATYSVTLRGRPSGEGTVGLVPDAMTQVRMPAPTPEPSPLPPWLRGRLGWWQDPPGRLYSALVVALAGSLFVAVTQLLNLIGDRDVFVGVAISVAVAGAQYAVVGAISRTRRAPLFFAACLAVLTMAVWIVVGGMDQDAIVWALILGGPVAAIVGAVIGTRHRPFRLAGLVVLGLWPLIVGEGRDIGPFVLNLPFVVLVTCGLAWFRPIGPKAAVKLAAAPYVLTLAGGLLVYADGSPGWDPPVFIVVTGLASASLAIVYWLERRRHGGRE